MALTFLLIAGLPQTFHLQKTNPTSAKPYKISIPICRCARRASNKATPCVVFPHLHACRTHLGQKHKNATEPTLGTAVAVRRWVLKSSEPHTGASVVLSTSDGTMGTIPASRPHHTPCGQGKLRLPTRSVWGTSVTL